MIGFLDFSSVFILIVRHSQKTLAFGRKGKQNNKYIFLMFRKTNVFGNMNYYFLGLLHNQKPGKQRLTQIQCFPERNIERKNYLYKLKISGNEQKRIL